MGREGREREGEGRGWHGGAAEEDIIMGRESEVAEDEKGKGKFVKGNGARAGQEMERMNGRTTDDAPSSRSGGERDEDGTTCFDLVQ